MKKGITLLFLVSVGMLISCKKDNSSTLSIDKNVFFTLSYNGKTLTQYGSKSTDINNTTVKYYESARIAKDSKPNESDIYITVMPTSNTSTGVGNHNLMALMHINKVGDSLGIYNNILEQSSILDYDVVPTTGYYINHANCVFTITNIDSEYVAGTFSFYLNIDTLVPATGSFKLNRF